MDSDIGFAIRAKMDGAVKEAISGIKECDWRPLVYRDGSESDKEEVCRTLHVMTKTRQAFTLIVQRKRIDDDDNKQLEIFINSDDETVGRGRYMYRAIATNLEGLRTCAQWENPVEHDFSLRFLANLHNLHPVVPVFDHRNN